MNMRYVTIAICWLALVVSASAAAEDKKMNEDLLLASGPPEQCVSLSRIDHVEVVDDQNILFYMVGKKIYQNHLPYRCSGLALRESFMYRTSLSQLCHLDIITVLENIGFGFSPGVSCGLGHFYPITKEGAKMLKEQKDRK